MAGNSEFGGKQGWTVGIFEWLNGPSSKVSRYWRLIEQGGGENAGRYLIGLWGPRAGTNFRPNSLIGGNLAEFGGFDAQKFVPFRTNEKAIALKAARRALWYFMGGGNGPNMTLLTPKDGKGSLQHRRKQMFRWLMSQAPLEKIPFVQGRIGSKHNPSHIAHRHYEHAVNNINPGALELQFLSQAVGAVIGAVDLVEEVKAAARLAPGLSMITTTSTVKYRNLKGQWMKNSIREINIKVATTVQEEVVALMEADKYLRPRTNDLVAAARDPRNRYPR
jgi:hypothetical protein